MLVTNTINDNLLLQNGLGGYKNIIIFQLI